MSVVIPSVNGPADLLDCLAALAAEAGRVPMEVLVVDRVGRDVRRAVADRHPWVRLIDAPPGTTIPDLRARGFAAASADVVGVLEDHVHVPPGWAERMLEAQRRGETVVGGAVENGATGRLVDWAAFLCEYSHLLPPLSAGPVASLTGNNTTYRRDLLERFRQAATSGRWEDYLHDVMRRHGVRLYRRPDIVVRHTKHYSVREYTVQRYLYARSYAAARVGTRSLIYRLAYGAAALALPPVLLARIVRQTWARPAYRGVLGRTLPLLAIFVCVWAAGEAAGAWFGDGGALSRVC